MTTETSEARSEAPRRPGPPGDRVNRTLIGAALALVAAILGLLVWMLASGLATPQAPRTSVERDIYAAEGPAAVQRLAAHSTHADSANSAAFVR